jgi:GMP synthase (glutamine-hydrolysing)
MTSRVLILDFGSQYTQLIARRIREFHVYSEIYPCQIPLEKIRHFAPQALILSGGPASVYDPNAPVADPALLQSGLPILGICYGMQWLSQHLGGQVQPGSVREYGPAQIRILERESLFEGFSEEATPVWMSHGDSVQKMPPHFREYAKSQNGLLAAIGDPSKKIFGLQFHPEVIHTRRGDEILKNFLFSIADLKADWSMESFVERQVREIRETVGKDHILCAVSGGVDSSVMAALIHRAVEGQLGLEKMDLSHEDFYSYENKFRGPF